MRKEYSLSVLLIALFGVIFVPSIEAGLSGLVASAAPGLKGSANDTLQFKAGGHLLGFQPRKVYFASLDHVLSVEFLGTPGVMPKTAAEGGETGNKPKVPTLRRVVYEELWEGISLTYEAREGGIAESTYHIGPWADVSKIRLGYNAPVEVLRDGSLKFKFDRGYLTESPPVAWQEIGGKRLPVAVAYRVKGAMVGFSVGPYDPNYPLTIDPTYAWHTFYGSSDIDDSYSIATDENGNVYIVGYDNTTWNGPDGQTPLNGQLGVFVLKLDSSGAYQWHTFYLVYGQCFAIATDSSGNVYVTGWSVGAWNGPAVESPLHAYSDGASNIFVLKLSSSGAYRWHTFYGPNGFDMGYGIATDGSGNVYVTGYSNATWNGPAGQTPIHGHSGSTDIFMLKLDSGGAYQWHTFHGPSNADVTSHLIAIATDESANVYVTADSAQTWNGPAGQDPLHAHSGFLRDIFVLKLSTNGSYQWHSFYGSGGNDWGYGIAADSSGNVYITGFSTAAWNGPAGESPLHDAFGSGFVLKLDSTGTYRWHTFYPVGYRIAIDSSGNAYVMGPCGTTWNGPDGQSPLLAYSGGTDICVLKINSSGAYQWHTFYGSSGNEHGYGAARDRTGNLYITGSSGATWNGPAGQSPLHAYTGGSRDFFVLKLSDAPISCDFDGDGKSDISFYRSSTGVWWIIPSSTGSAYGVGWGGDPSDIPVAGNYDGDGKSDIAFYRSNTGTWWIIPSSGVGPQGQVGAYGVGWGGSALKPVPGDYDGDGKTDIAIYDTTGGAWWVIPSSGAPAYGVGWGGSGFKPVHGDYDGDGIIDISIYDTTSGGWWIIPSSGTGPQGQVGAYGIGWGGSAFLPVPGDYDGDGKTDIAIYDTASGGWWIIPSSGIGPQGQVGAYGVGWGGSGFTPVPGDYDGDGNTDIAIYETSTGIWWVVPSSGAPAYGMGWGGDASDVALYH